MNFLYQSDVQLISHIGGDDSVVKAMLVSTLAEDSIDQTATYGRINYLMRQRHGSPFEHNQFTFFLKTQYMTAHQILRHRTFSFNEQSGRYREFGDEFYLPPPERPLIQVGKVSLYEFNEGTPEQYARTSDTMIRSYRDSWEKYQLLLKDGIAKEVARLVLPVGLMTCMYATCNARALMNFLSLRVHGSDANSSPQYEIEQVALAMEEHFATEMPLTYKSFCENGRIAP